MHREALRCIAMHASALRAARSALTSSSARTHAAGVALRCAALRCAAFTAGLRGFVSPPTRFCFCCPPWLMLLACRPRATPVHVTSALCSALSDRHITIHCTALTAAADLNRASPSRPLFHPPVFVKPFLDRESEFSLSTPFLSPTFAVQVPVTFRVHARPIAARGLSSSKHHRSE